MSSISHESSGKEIILVGGIFLFFYFGIIIVPEWLDPFSALGFLWLLALPFVVFPLIGIGIAAAINLWRAKQQNKRADTQHKIILWFSIIGILWGVLAYGLANLTFDVYMHKEFDSVTWENTNWSISRSRERMLDDLTTNVLSDQTRGEILSLLSEPDRELKYDEVHNKESLIYYLGDGLVGYHCLIISFNKEGEFLGYGTADCD